MSRARDVADFLPLGGGQGTLLAKASGEDFDTEWVANTVSIPPIGPGDEGTALVIENGTPKWGGVIDAEAQIIEGGEY